MKQNTIQSRLEEEFQRLKDQHRRAIIIRATRVVLGISTLRVYESGTKQQLTTCFNAIPFDEILSLQNQEDYRIWFERELNRVAKEIEKANGENSKIHPGYDWGHAAKLLNLQIREVVLNSRYFTDDEVKRIEPWLYQPIDSIVMDNLKKLGIKLPFTKIKEIDTPEKFYLVQNLLKDAANRVGIPSIWFDDVWGDRKKERK